MLNTDTSPTGISVAAPYIIDIIVVLGAISLCYLTFYTTIPTANAQLINTITGVVLAWASTIVNYYRGSSSGSTEKSKQITSLINNAQSTKVS